MQVTEGSEVDGWMTAEPDNTLRGLNARGYPGKGNQLSVLPTEKVSKAAMIWGSNLLYTKGFH